MQSIIDEIDNPKHFISKLYALLIMALIYLSVLIVVIEAEFPKFFNEYVAYFSYSEYVILTVFTLELLLRMAVGNRPLRYLTSFYGVVDLISVLPGLVSLFFVGMDNTVWARIFKIFRIMRIFKAIRTLEFLDGITARVIPYIAFTIALKGVMVMLESNSWWPEIKNISTFIAVVGFALAVLMGTKLSVVNGRIYQIEDAVCRIVGSLRDLHFNKSIDKTMLHDWSTELERTLKFKRGEKHLQVKKMRQKTDLLEKHFETVNIGGPNTAGFHRDVAYLLHRVVAKTPLVYDNFLKHIIVTYTLVVIFVLPGLGGLILSTLLVYVLGGVYFIIEDMDNPLSYEDNSFIVVRLDALESYNEELGKLLE